MGQDLTRCVLNFCVNQSKRSLVCSSEDQEAKIELIAKKNKSVILYTQPDFGQISMTVKDGRVLLEREFLDYVEANRLNNFAKSMRRYISKKGFPHSVKTAFYEKYHF